MDSITVSVIVPAYNASATIGKTIEALSRQNCFQPFEVIVVDDGSSDNTGEIVCSFLPGKDSREQLRVSVNTTLRGNDMGIKYVRQDNAGPASARNHGAELARGEFLAFTDSDCIPHEDWISQLMAGFDQNHVGVVCGSYGIANPEHCLARCVFKEILWRHTNLMPDFPNSFGSYNFCVKKSVFDAVGGFNSDYAQASGEDNDLSYKIRQSGWRIYFQRKALVDHHHPTGVFKYMKEQFRHGFWRVRMYIDHPRMMRGDGYTYWKDIIEMPIAVFFLGGLVLSAANGVSLGVVACSILFPLLLFEISCALIMSKGFFEGIFFGFVMAGRAFARMFGFSTGILSLWTKKRSKIFQ